MSTIKVDTIATRTGSGNITVSNNIAGAGTISGTNITASGTLDVTGNTTMGGTAAITGNVTASTIALGGRSFNAGNTPLGVNFSSASGSGLHINDTNSGNLGGMLQFYSGAGTGTLRANIQNANNTGIHFNVGTNGSIVFDQTGYTAANALDDYEKGTWTPAWATGSGQTYGQQMGTYVKIGRQVMVTCFIMTSDMNGQTGDAAVGGLPFTASQGTFGTFPRAWGVVNGDNNWDTNLSTNNLVAQIAGGGSTIRPRYNSGLNTSDVQLQQIGGGNSYFGATVIYETDS